MAYCVWMYGYHIHVYYRGKKAVISGRIECSNTAS